MPMPSLQLSIPLSFLLLISTIHLSSSTTTIDVHDLLPDYGFPRGLIPNSVKSYTISSTGEFAIQFATQCYVHFDDQLVWYDKEIKGKLSYGSVHDVNGIQAKKLFIWLPVSGIEISKDDGGKMIEFFVGSLSEKLPFNEFEEVPACKSKVNDDAFVNDFQSM